MTTTKLSDAPAAGKRRSPKAYRMLRDSKLEPRATAGTAVYEQAGYDYGLSSDDTRITGIEHISVTLNEDGDYPGFTVPVHDLEPLP
jgi:hypothetical protein